MLGLGIGLDCGTKTGFCVIDMYSGKVIASGVQDFSKRRGESNGLMFMKFRRWLKDLMNEANACSPYGLRIVAYERAHFRGGAATEICVGLQTRVQELAEEFRVPSAPVTTAELKKYVTGKGQAPKIAMIERAAKVLDRNPEDDNEADAVIVSLWMLSNHD